MESELTNFSLVLLRQIDELLVNQADINGISIAVTHIDRLFLLIEEIFDVIPAIWSSIIILLEEACTYLELSIMDQEVQPVGKGRPKISIPISHIEYLLSLNFNATTIGEMFGVSYDTIRRRLSEVGQSVTQSYSEINDEELESKIFEILVQYPNTGYKRMKGFLLQAGIKCTDQKVRIAMRKVDPEGVYQRLRQNRAIVRRQYFVTYSNEMWHLDTNMKLNRWKIIIRGCVDGKSRTVTYLQASADNRAQTNLLAFLEGVNMYGVPLRTRSDKGKENILIAKFMLETRGLNRASHICGRSVHNQRIERYWRDVTYGCTAFYKNVLLNMEDEGVLNIEDEVHLFILHKVFLPRFNRHLTGLMNAWNCHPLSTEKNQSPRQIMVRHMFPPNMDLELSSDDRLNIELMCNEMVDLIDLERQPEDEMRFPECIDPIISDNLRQHLLTMDPLSSSANYGKDIFLAAVQQI